MSTSSWQGSELTAKYAVHLGIWTNWSRGRVMGATLTLPRTEGNYLLAFTSLFITVVAGCFWSIARRGFHRCYSTSAPRDALHHQRQAVFRNSSASESFQVLCWLAWTWRHTANGKRFLLRLVPGALAAAFVVVAFGIASGFSSQISSAIGTQVRIDGANCSLVNGQADDPNYDTFSLMPYRAQMVSNSANYAQQCYSTNSSAGIFDCTSFVKSKLPTTVDMQAACPFASELCRSDNSNIRLDTGYIDSHADLGMNAPANERILFRAVLSCAPLTTAGFETNITTDKGNYTRYDYGNQTTGENYTYMVRSVQDQYSNAGSEGGRGMTFILAPYIESSFNGSTYMPASSFQATPGYFPRDADVTIIFLSGNDIRFSAPVNDPWYRATIPDEAYFPINKPASPSNDLPTYRPEQAASPMACLQQFQFCDASPSRCGPLSSWADAQTDAGVLFGTTLETDDPPAENDPPASAFYWFVALMSYSVPQLTTVLLQLGASSLASTRSLYSGVMGPLPDNQWQVDVMQWWAAYLASIQAGVVSTASGPRTSSVEHLRIKPYNKWIQDHVCANQIVLSSDYTSFSLFGLYFTYILGLIIIIVAFTLETVLDSLSTRFHRGTYSYLEWTSTDTLQLQRMAFQGVKSGTWSGSSNSIPITSQAGEIMANLPFEYPLGKACREKPASNIATKAAAGTSMPVSAPKRSTTSPEDPEAQNKWSEIDRVSTMATEVSPITPTLTGATLAQAQRPN